MILVSFYVTFIYKSNFTADGGGGSSGVMLNPNIKVLVVEDFPTMRNIIKNLFKQIGFKNIEEAEDGLQALDKLKGGGYDLVLSDWNMPNMEGIELLRNMRKDPVLKDIPFLMVTAEAGKDKIIKAIRSGVNYYIVKPFTSEALNETLIKMSEKHSSLRPKH